MRAIQLFLGRKLREEGVEIVEMAVNRPERVLVEHEWVLKLAGPKGTATGFAPVATAQAVLGARLLEKLPEEYRGCPLCLWVTPVSALSHRMVGWSAGLCLA